MDQPAISGIERDRQTQNQLAVHVHNVTKLRQHALILLPSKDPINIYDEAVSILAGFLVKQ